jgi:hypothetical protein
MLYPPLYLPAQAPEFYDELAKGYWPHPLQDDRDYGYALEVIDWLAAQAATKDQHRFLLLLRERVEDYESAPGEPRWCGVSDPRLRKVLSHARRDAL